jgi:hypothetical protein
MRGGLFHFLSSMSELAGYIVERVGPVLHVGAQLAQLLSSSAHFPLDGGQLIVQLRHSPRHELGLREIDASLQNIERLALEDDLDWKLVNERIRSIENVELLVLPKGISKFQMLTKARNVEKIRTA